MVRLRGPGARAAGRQVGKAEEDGTRAAGGGELAVTVGEGFGRCVGGRRGRCVALVEDLGEGRDGLVEGACDAEPRAGGRGGVGEGEEFVGLGGGKEEGELFEGEAQGVCGIVEREVRALEDFQGAGNLLWRERGVGGDGGGGNHEYG